MFRVHPCYLPSREKYAVALFPLASAQVWMVTSTELICGPVVRIRVESEGEG